MSPERCEIEIMRAIRSGAHYRAVIAHRIGAPMTSVSRSLAELVEDGLVKRTDESRYKARYELL